MRLSLLALACALAACTPLNPEAWMAYERNACLPTAIAMREGLERQGIQAHVVRYSYLGNGTLTGHAVTSYLYPPGDNKLWVYDYEGSTRARAFFADPLGTARAAESARGRKPQIFSSEFLD
jgi:hypothetical protein